MSTVEEDDSHRMRPQPSVPHPQLQQQQQLSSGGSGSSMNWEPMRQRLVGSSDLLVCLAAANELLALLETVPLSEFPLMLSALLPSFSSVLTSKTKPVADLSSIEHQLRTVVLEWMGKLLLVRPQGGTEVLRPHAPHLVAVAMDVLTRDYEENAVAASRLLFDLYKTYRSLPTDCVQPYLDYVTALYRALPLSVQRNFSQPLLLPPVAMLPTTTATPTVVPIPETSATAPSVQSVVVPGQPEVEHDEDPDAMETDRLEVSTKTEPMDEARTTKLPEALASTENAETASALPTAESEATEMSTLPEASTTTSVPLASSLSVTSITSLQQPSPPILLKSNASFRVLTECPLVIMLMFQLYPQFMKANIPVLIKVMMEALALRPPTLQSVAGVGSTTSKIDSSLKRLYFSRTRELVAAQAKTLSFLTYLLRTFATELKPYEDRLATNVVALMTTCPRESIATRKELLVATRHLLNSEFRSGFYRHIDSMLDERLLMGTTSTSHSSSHRPDPTIIRPLACTTLSDFVQHVRTLLTMTQMSKVVCFFSRILHDVSLTLPLTTQYTAVRTLLSVIDLIFHNKDPDPQLGRDMLVRMLDTLVDKLQALAEYFPDVLEAERKRDARDSDTRNVFESPFSEDDAKLKHDWLLLNNNHHHHNPPDSVRDVQSMIRAIIVGLKTIIYYICTYRAQRVELTSKDGSPTTTTSCEQALFMPPAGSNEEVYSAMLKVTSTEITIIDRYIVTAMSAMKLLVESGTREGGDKGALTIAPPLGRPSTGEKSLSEQYRDALTYFAAAFTALDGYNLRRSLGRRMDVLIDAIVENPMVMIVPRHLLGSNATTSYEFCSILLDYLVERMDLLCYPRCLDVIFIDEQRDHDISEQQYVRERLHAVSQLPAEGDERVKQRSTTMLQLFERVLKSLSVYPENEAMVRRHLRRIVVVCLRSSMENIDNWPEIYCMLLRYVFRSISAGKFEDSYRELLPLIPSVLNGLYCVICSVEDDTALRSTAIELCLTIPARLSSLLPHMNLLLRVIIPALDSTSGDLVNLGLRTLEFWVDNLNPLFLYPEMSKQTELFTSLMQSLSRHLRPAPYPYGLLTLRLLGKLGGKNRQFLREPMLICAPTELDVESEIAVDCFWSRANDAMEEPDSCEVLSVHLPLGRCVETLKMIALTHRSDEVIGNTANNIDCTHLRVGSHLWECKIENLDIASYSKEVIDAIKKDQASASLIVIRSAIEQVFDRISSGVDGAEKNDILLSDEKNICIGLLYACMVDATKDDAWVILKDLAVKINQATLAGSLALFLSEPSSLAAEVGLQLLDFLLNLEDNRERSSNDALFDVIVCSLCETCCSSSWGRQSGPQEAMCKMTATLGTEWSRRHEVKLVNAAFLPVKTVPRDVAEAAINALKVFIQICSTLYGKQACHVSERDMMVWDILSSDERPETWESKDSSEPTDVANEANPVGIRPSEEVFKLCVYELTSPQQLVRFAARFLLKCFVVNTSTKVSDYDFVSNHVDLIRRVLFSRSLRLLPLPHQVGVVEGVTAIIKQFPNLLPLTDQHFLACLSELLKMASVADGEMTDDKLKEAVVDKNGFVPCEADSDSSQYPTHASALFFRRECVVAILGVRVVVPGELPAGIQLRVSTIVLLHAIIRIYADPFFEAESTTAIGNIRPHVISLLFRTLVSSPLKAVNAAHNALRDVLALSLVAETTEGNEEAASQSRLPKELLQTCIRPVLLHLREYTRLSVPLLRGLTRLLSLLSSWFNKTLGEKLLDHLRKWTDPSRIMSHKIWKEGEEPLVAAAIVGIFSSLPHAAQFVEHLVKTCIKLEATLPSFKARFVESPYRRPLARYLNKHAQYTVSFFFPRLKTPMYSELFQYILQLDDSTVLRDFLSNKQFSVMLLNVCFERPLAIIRSEKTSSPRGSSKGSLSMHGIGKQPADSADPSSATQKPMNIEALEVQQQGFRLVSTLVANNPNYFSNHNDIVRALRWLWRSKGRFLRLQHEDVVSPRFHDESKMLASFLMNYAKSFPSEDLDILFELFRVFLQPSTADFSFLSRFLLKMVTHVLSFEQKRKVVQRFFDSIAGDTNEEIKILGIQFLVFPMLSADYQLSGTACQRASSGRSILDTQGYPGEHIAECKIYQSKLTDNGVIKKFVDEVIFQEGTLITCCDRLKVELLRLSNLFVEYEPIEVEPFRKEMVKYCWGLIKSEDTPCKCWAYVVLCRFISAFDTPVKIVRQVYVSLLRFHHQESKDLVRAALDLLVPALPRRLPDEDFRKVIELTSHLMVEEGSSIPHLAHISQTIIRNPEIFQSQCGRFAPHLISSLHRLGLPPTGPHENRVVAVSVVELLLFWDHKLKSDMGNILADHADNLCNFIVRLKLLIAEVSTDAKTVKVDAAVLALDFRATALLDAVISKWSPVIRAAPLEKCVTSDLKATGPLLVCLELISTAVKFRYYDFLSHNASLTQNIIALVVEHARDDTRLQIGLRKFVSCSKVMTSLSAFLLISLEKIVEEASCDQKKASALGRGSDSNPSRSKERPGGVNDASALASYGNFALELISELCENGYGSLNVIATSLLSLAKTLSRAHLSDAAAKQRQGSSNAPHASVSGIRHHTPTIGILEEACLRDQATASRITKGRPGNDDVVLSTSLRSLVVILSIFESSDVMYAFTQNRKALLQIINGILETSDNVQLLMITVRCIGKWLMSENPGSPLTAKERNSLLGRIGAFDSSNLPDDVVAQPLTDLIGFIVLRFIYSPQFTWDAACGRLAAACLLNADHSARDALLLAYVSCGSLADKNVTNKTSKTLFALLLLVFHTDFEGLGARFWVVVFVDILMCSLVSKHNNCVASLRILAQGNISLCLQLFETLLPWAWSKIPNDVLRVQLIASMEALLSKTYHSQLFRSKFDLIDARCINSVRTFLNALLLLNPIPVLDTHLLVSLAENYNCWYEVLSLLEKYYHVMKLDSGAETAISAMRHCYRQLGEVDMWHTLARESCVLAKTSRAISLDTYDMIQEAVNEYVELIEIPASELEPTTFEMDLWEERWILLQKELCQFQVVSEFANASECPSLQLECAWKAQDWAKVRSLCSSTALFPEVENGDPIVKMSETLLAVADGKLSDVENLHAQTAQLCLYKWQLLPRLSNGSLSHASLFHFFHRLVEIRESGQIMVETSNHASGRTLPDLKNLLSAWRHRLPNDWERLSMWDEVFAWRAHMFSAITSNFQWCEPDTLATQHDRPWTALRMAKAARKQGMRDVALLLLSKATEEQAMNVSDAFLKLREQILAYFNPESKLERHGGLNLINATNLSLFDASQKSELFRLRASFLESLQGRSKANQAYCHAVQICPTHARAWDSWGELCASLGAATEKQLEQGGTEINKDGAKKVRQYLAQAMGCYLEAIQIDGHEWARIRIPKCLWILSKDGSVPGVLCQTLESRGAHLPAWVWLPWIPQLLTSLYRREGRAIKTILARLVDAYPQAVYYPLRAFYLERRDVDRVKSSSASSSPVQHQGSVSLAEELMSMLRRSHASLWSSLESCLEELIVKFRPSYEEELLATIIVLLERAETQVGSMGKVEDEASVVLSVWKTLGKIAIKFFRPIELASAARDARAEKTAQFKDAYKSLFEDDFHVSASEQIASSPPEKKPPLILDDIIEKLRGWKRRLEDHVLASPDTLSLIEASHSLAMFGVGDAPDLWPGSCDPLNPSSRISDRESNFETDAGTTHSTTSSSAAAARKAAKSAATAAAEAAMKEGVGGNYGGGSSWIEVPGQYIPNTSSWTDVRPSPELHAKLLKFEPSVSVLRRSDTLVRRIGMVASDGKTYHFLLQFAVPYLTRTDERSSQTHYVLNKALRKVKRSSRAQLSVQSDPVIPVAQRLRLISEPLGRTSLENINRQVCKRRQTDHSELLRVFNDEVKTSLLKETTNETMEEKVRLELEKTIRLDVYSRICSSDGVDNFMLTDHLLRILEGPEPHYQFRRMFAQQWAANCLLQYAFSASERTPSKVVFDVCSGRVLAPEFRIAYTNQGCFEPQCTPFRLTPNLLNLIEFPFLDARFITSMAIIAGAVQSCQQDLDPIFRLLMRDDLVAFYTKSMAKSDSKTIEMEKQLAGSLSRNVATLVARFAECTPAFKWDALGMMQEGPIDQKVRDLVEAAREPENLCMMSASYQGWL